MDIGLYLSYPATFWRHGGGETIYLKSLQYSQSTEHNIVPLNPPASRTYDIIHVIGSSIHNDGVLEAAREAGSNTVLSSIWYSMKSNYILRAARFAHYVPMLTRYNIRRRIFDSADIVVANSVVEAEQVNLAFGVLREKIRVVRLAVDKKFSTQPRVSFAENYGITDYILCVARVNSRKAQLTVLQTAAELGKNVVFIGGADPSDPEYVKMFEKAMNEEHRIHTLWLRGIPHDSDTLHAAYKEAAVHVLASRGEFPGLASLEAAMAGVPVVVEDAPTVREYLGNFAFYSTYGNGHSLKRAIEDALNSNPEQMYKFVKERYTWERYMQDIGLIYDEVKGL